MTEVLWHNVTGNKVFRFLGLFFFDCKHLLFPCIFHCKKTFFRGLFCIKSNWSQKKSPRKWSLIMIGLYFQRLFISRTFFHMTFLVPKFRTLFPKTFFQELFWRLAKFILYSVHKYIILSLKIKQFPKNLVTIKHKWNI